MEPYWWFHSTHYRWSEGVPVDCFWRNTSGNPLEPDGVLIWYFLRIFCWRFQLGFSRYNLHMILWRIHDARFRWILKPSWYYSWGSDLWTYWTLHREQHVHLESSDLRDICNQRNISEYEYHFNTQDVGWVIRYPFHSLHSGYEIRVSSFSTLTTVTIWNRLHDGHIVWGWFLPRPVGNA